MLQAFGSGNMKELKKTLSENTVWNYNGTSAIPYSGTFKGKEGAIKFINTIMTNVEILDFKVNEIASNGKTVVVLGFEKQKIKKNGKILEQNWVQVYTVENGLITKMEEYANTAAAERNYLNKTKYRAVVILHNARLVYSMKVKKIICWVSTGLFGAFLLFSGYSYLFNPDMKTVFRYMDFSDFSG